MRMLLVALALVAVGCDIYTYTQTRAGETVRAHRITGKTEVLRRDTQGRDQWVVVKSGAEIAKDDAAVAASNAAIAADLRAAEEAREREVARCEPSRIDGPRLSTIDLTVKNTMGDLWLASVNNRSSYVVLGVEGELTGLYNKAPISTEHFAVPIGSRQRETIVPGAVADYGFSAHLPNVADHYQWRLTGATVYPGDCSRSSEPSRPQGSGT